MKLSVSHLNWFESILFCKQIVFQSDIFCELVEMVHIKLFSKQIALLNLIFLVSQLNWFELFKSDPICSCMTFY